MDTPSQSNAPANVSSNAPSSSSSSNNANVHAIVKAQIVFLLSTLTEENFEQNQLQIRTVRVVLWELHLRVGAFAFNSVPFPIYLRITSLVSRPLQPISHCGRGLDCRCYLRLLPVSLLIYIECSSFFLSNSFQNNMASTHTSTSSDDSSCTPKRV